MTTKIYRRNYFNIDSKLLYKLQKNFNNTVFAKIIDFYFEIYRIAVYSIVCCLYTPFNIHVL